MGGQEGDRERKDWGDKPAGFKFDQSLNLLTLSFPSCKAGEMTYIEHPPGTSIQQLDRVEVPHMLVFFLLSLLAQQRERMGCSCTSSCTHTFPDCSAKKMTQYTEGAHL